MNKSLINKIANIIIVITLAVLLIQYLDVKLNREPRWRDGVSSLVCKPDVCTVKVYDKNLNLLNTKHISLSEIKDFTFVVDKSRVRDNYAAYVLMAVKDDGETFDFFEVDTYYDNEIEKSVEFLRKALEDKNLSVTMKYPASRAKKYYLFDF